jgi:2',3'-cyclic-nucleotide 2'-phosphodiesterase/3'-nucleotidase
MLSKFYASQKHFCLLLLFLLSPALVFSAEQNKKSDSKDIVRLRIIGFSDLHGSFLTYDHLHKRQATSGLPWIYSFVKQERKDTTQQVILLNSGDFLQGSMAAYYYNYIDQRDVYMPFVFMSRVGVDASVVGNHDLEPGAIVMRRIQREGMQLNTEIISANVFAERTQIRLLRPYVMLERNGLRIAVLGLSTPVLTGCARTKITQGVDVQDMLEPARYWVNRIQKTEYPDLIIGLFHAGFVDRSNLDPAFEDCINANDPLYIAKNVPGFDGFILGHQHRLFADSIYVSENPFENIHSSHMIDSVVVEGRSVWLVEPGFGGRHVGILDFEVRKIPGERAKILSASASTQDVTTQVISQDIFDEFAKEERRISKEANRVIAVFEPPKNRFNRLFRKPKPISSIDAYFGSNFVDIVHKVQLDPIEVNVSEDSTLVIQADVSFTSPLASDITFTPGDKITFSYLLRMYRFENKLAFLRMTGQEIKDYLEYSYGLWVNQMHSPSDPLLRLNKNENLPFLFEIPAFNFDSGAGLDYEVDVTKPVGERIAIFRMWNDKPFHKDSTYIVALNSYRFAGAGGHLELGAKIPPEELQNRSVWILDAQVRDLIRQEFINQGNVRSFHYNNWRFVPEEFVSPAKQREREVIYRYFQNH